MRPGNRSLFAFVLATTLAASSCGKLTQQADATFGDQNFKTSIALIELYHHGLGLRHSNVTTVPSNNSSESP